MTLNITKGTVPTIVSNRTREPNPFDGLFPTPEGESLVVVLPSATEDEQKMVNRVATQAQTAARESVSEEHPHGFTARVHREACRVNKNGDEVKTGGTEGTKLTIWSTKRVFRPGSGRKATETATPDAS